jgi:hypothetical protein
VGLSLEALSDALPVSSTATKALSEAVPVSLTAPPVSPKARSGGADGCMATEALSETLPESLTATPVSPKACSGGADGLSTATDFLSKRIPPHSMALEAWSEALLVSLTATVGSSEAVPVSLTASPVSPKARSDGADGLSTASDLSKRIPPRSMATEVLSIPLEKGTSKTDQHGERSTTLKSLFPARETRSSKRKIITRGN